MSCQILVCDVGELCCVLLSQMVKEQKGRIEELMRSKQESVGQLKVSGCGTYLSTVNGLPLCLVCMQCLVTLLSPYKARIAELEVEVGTRNKLELKLEAIQEVCCVDVMCGVLHRHLVPCDPILRRMQNCIPSCLLRHQLLKVCAKRGSFGARSWLTKVCWEEGRGVEEEKGKRERGEGEEKVHATSTEQQNVSFQLIHPWGCI